MHRQDLPDSLFVEALDIEVDIARGCILSSRTTSVEDDVRRHTPQIPDEGLQLKEREPDLHLPQEDTFHVCLVEGEVSYILTDDQIHRLEVFEVFADERDIAVHYPGDLPDVELPRMVPPEQDEKDQRRSTEERSVRVQEVPGVKIYGGSAPFSHKLLRLFIRELPDGVSIMLNIVQQMLTFPHRLLSVYQQWYIKASPVPIICIDVCGCVFVQQSVAQIVRFYNHIGGA